VIFQHTFEAVLSGKKTQTRRIAAPEPNGESCAGFEMISYPMGIKAVVRGSRDDMKWNVKWQVNKDYAVCPGRGKSQVARIRLTDIRREDVRCISEQDAVAEALYSPFEFLEVWTHMHDKPAWNAQNNTDFSDGDESGRISHSAAWMSWLKGTRPAERYQAWVLTFELVQP
jgi:hypothetical protein